MFEKGELLHEGKGKKVYSVKGDDQKIWLEFKDDLTAFNAEKRGSFENKGQLNLAITEIIFKELKKHHIKTHWVEKLSDKDLVVRKLKMVPLEVVIRNVLAGSTAKKFCLEEGTPLEKPLFELFYKDDGLGDPFINDSQAVMLKAVTDVKEIVDIKTKALDINDVLEHMFDEIGIRLVDFKLEFGYSKDGVLCLGDEISPDSCRLWDKETQEKLDKDRFRRDLGKVAESYQEVYQRLNAKFGIQK